jgi:membrane protease YdiL (CAAX protease family)
MVETEKNQKKSKKEIMKDSEPKPEPTYKYYHPKAYEDSYPVYQISSHPYSDQSEIEPEIRSDKKVKPKLKPDDIRKPPSTLRPLKPAPKIGKSPEGLKGPKGPKEPKEPPRSEIPEEPTTTGDIKSFPAWGPEFPHELPYPTEYPPPPSMTQQQYTSYPQRPPYGQPQPVPIPVPVHGPVPPPPPPPPIPHQPPPPQYQPYPPIIPYQYPYPMPYGRPKFFQPYSEIPLILIFLVCLSVYWIPYIIAGLIGVPFYEINPDFAEVVAGAALCVITICLMVLIRSNLDRPTLKDYGFTTENLGDNLKFTVKLIFIIYAVETVVILIFQFLGVSFEGGVSDINIYFIISAVIIAPIFEETVYRMNASTLLARRIPIIWVAAITSTWFIAKHIPMWHFDNDFGLPALGVILMINIPVWIIVTYYYLKRNCIWIPFLVHVFNNGAIAMFHYLPEDIGFITDQIFFFIGVIFIFVFGIPWFNKSIISKIHLEQVKFTKKTSWYLMVSIGLILLLLVTSEALVSIQNFNELVCLPIGLALFLVSLLTVAYVLSNKTVEYVKAEQIQDLKV